MEPVTNQFKQGKMLAAAAAALLLLSPDQVQAQSISFSAVSGFFLQDLNSTNATSFDYTAVNFGLINQTYDSDGSDCTSQTQWQRFGHYVNTLNHQTPLNTKYKVLFMGRHGEGYHNAAESYFGTPAWNCYWSLINGNSSVSWADAHLTTNGIHQALIANAFWQHEITTQKIPTPQSFYTSPLYRCLETANLTFSSGLSLDKHCPFIPTVKELLREGISLHTCDRRSNKTFIHASFPSYKIETGFAEHDPLWDPVYQETSTGQDIRSATVLRDIFTSDTATWISITSHSGEIASILRVLGHRPFSLNTGAVIPVLVKVVTQHSGGGTNTNSTTMTTSPVRATSAHCTSPPLTSVSSSGGGGNCVCMSGATPVTSPLVTNIP